MRQGPEGRLLRHLCRSCRNLRPCSLRRYAMRRFLHGRRLRAARRFTHRPSLPHSVRFHRPLRLQIRVHHQLRFPQGMLHRIHNRIVDQHTVRKTHLQLLGMHVDIHDLRIHIDHQHRIRELMLHQEGPVAVLDGLCDHRVPDEALVYEIHLVIPVGPGDDRLSDEAADRHGRQSGQGRALVGPVHRDQLVRHVPPIDRVDHIQERSVSQCRQELLPILQVAERHLRVGQCLLLQDILDPGGLGLRTFQKLPAGRYVFKEVPHDEGGAVRGADLRKILFNSALDLIMHCHQRSRRLRDQLHPGDARDGGQRLAAEAEGLDALEIPGIPDLRGGMPKEGIPHILPGDAGAVVRHPDHRDAAVPDLHRHRGAPGIDGILQKLLHHAERALDHLTGRNLIDGLIT